MDYILTFNNYCEIYLKGKNVSFYNAKTKQQRITEFKWGLDELTNKIKENFSEQINSLTSMAFKDGYGDMAALNLELQNSLRDQLRNFRAKQEQRSGLYD